MAVALDVNPIHFGIITVINLEIGMVTLPLSLNLFVASGMSVLRAAKASLPFALVLLFALLIVTYVPDLALAFVETAETKE